MDILFQFLLAVMVGIASADLFVRGWNCFLQCAACIVLLLQRKIPLKIFLSRLSGVIPMTILYFLLLVLCFKVYFSILGFGLSEMEQLGYFMGAVPRTGFYLMNAGKLIEAMFRP
jgi:hypothetical protein